IRKSHVSYLPFMAVVISLLASWHSFKGPGYDCGSTPFSPCPANALERSPRAHGVERARDEARNSATATRGVAHGDLRGRASAPAFVCTESGALRCIRHRQRDLRGASPAR